MQISQSGLDHLRKDPIMARVIDIAEPKTYSVHLDSFNSLCNSIVSQQVSLPVAKILFSRLHQLFDLELTPEKVRQIAFDDLKSIGLSRQKTSYIKNVADFYLENTIDDVKLSEMTDEELIDLLTQIKGIGVWTVRMQLIFFFERPDVFAPGDHAIQQAMIELYGLKEEKRALQKKMIDIAEAWKPHRSLACLYLWRYRSTDATKK